MGWREQQIYLAECSSWVHLLRTVTRPPCGDRRWPGSHIACCLNVEHEGEHESNDGDTWTDADPDAEERAELRLLAALLPLGARPVPL